MDGTEARWPRESTKNEHHQVSNGFDDLTLQPDSEFWVRQLDEWRVLFNSAACVMARHTISSATVSALCASNLNGSSLQLYERVRQLGNLFSNKGYHLKRGMVVTTGNGPVTKAQLNSSFFREWMQPQSLSHAMCAVVDVSDDFSFCLEFYRLASYGIFTQDEVDSVTSLIPQARALFR